MVAVTSASLSRILSTEGVRFYGINRIISSGIQERCVDRWHASLDFTCLMLETPGTHISYVWFSRFHLSGLSFFSFCFRLVGFTSDGDVVFYYSTAEITIPSRKSALIVVEFGLLALQTTSADY